MFHPCPKVLPVPCSSAALHRKHCVSEVLHHTCHLSWKTHWFLQTAMPVVGHTALRKAGRTAAAHPTFTATWDRAYSSKWWASLLNLRIPSASFSVAIASSLCIQRKVFSSKCKRCSLLACAFTGS